MGKITNGKFLIMKSKPILFSTPMVQAILEGRKTQTRRIVKKQFLNGDEPRFSTRNSEATGVCPFGKIGDVLWVRETFFKNPNTGVFVFKAATEMRIIDTDFVKWKPSIFMPKEIARIWLRITNISVETLVNLFEEDAISEGVEVLYKDENTVPFYKNYLTFDSKGTISARNSFRTLWQSIHGEDSWNSNPWVWVIEFERIEKPSEV